MPEPAVYPTRPGWDYDVCRNQQGEPMALKLRKLSYALGAEVCGVDVAKAMSESTFGEIYHAFLQHGILLFRDQDITREQHIEFSRRFGELDRHEALPRDRHPRYPELLMVTNEPSDGTCVNDMSECHRWPVYFEAEGLPSFSGMFVTSRSSG